jgi:hypothetical protein
MHEIGVRLSVKNSEEGSMRMGIYPAEEDGEIEAQPAREM